jgi:hypothetical protein
MAVNANLVENVNVVYDVQYLYIAETVEENM